MEHVLKQAHSARGLPKEMIENVLTYLPDQRERIRATGTSKAFLEVRGSYEGRGKLWRRLSRVAVCTQAYCGCSMIAGLVFEYSDGSASRHVGFRYTGAPRIWQGYRLAHDDDLATILCKQDDENVYFIKFITRKGRHREHGEKDPEYNFVECAVFEWSRFETPTAILDINIDKSEYGFKIWSAVDCKHKDIHDNFPRYTESESGDESGECTECRWPPDLSSRCRCWMK